MRPPHLIGRRDFLAGAGALTAALATRPARAVTNAFSINVMQTPFLSITPGREFATTAWCYQKLAANAPLDPNSGTIARNFFNAIQPSGAVSILNNVPIWRVSANAPTQTVRIVHDVTNFVDATGDWAAWLRAQFTAVPIPPGFTPGTPDDSEAVIYQPSTGKLWEGWQWFKDPQGVWCIVWGGYESSVPTSDGTWAPQGPSAVKEGMVASGIHWLSLVITLGDMAQQAINHPVGLVCPIGSVRSDVWNRPPAWRTDGYPPQLDPNVAAEGCIFRLPASIDLEAYQVTAWDGVSVKRLQRLVAEAIRDYGCVLMDQGGTCIANMESSVPYGPVDPTLNDPIISQVLGASHPWGYDNQYLQIPQPAPADHTADFPWDKLQLLRTNLVNTP